MKFPQNFRKTQNLPEIFATFRNSYEFHSQIFYISLKTFINNYYIYKIYPTTLTDQNCGTVYTYECRKIRVSGAHHHLLGYYKKMTSVLLPDSKFANAVNL